METSFIVFLAKTGERSSLMLIALLSPKKTKGVDQKIPPRNLGEEYLRRYFMGCMNPEDIPVHWQHLVAVTVEERGK